MWKPNSPNTLGIKFDTYEEYDGFVFPHKIEVERWKSFYLEASNVWRYFSYGTRG